MSATCTNTPEVSSGAPIVPSALPCVRMADVDSSRFRLRRLWHGQLIDELVDTIKGLAYARAGHPYRPYTTVLEYDVLPQVPKVPSLQEEIAELRQQLSDLHSLVDDQIIHLNQRIDYHDERADDLEGWKDAMDGDFDAMADDLADLWAEVFDEDEAGG